MFDIFSLNDLETDTVRLNASTIKQLFEDTGYNLKDVRKKKLVKPIALTLLPQEIKMIESLTRTKEQDKEQSKEEDNLSSLTVSQHRNISKTYKLRGYSKFRKKDLIAFIHKNKNNDSKQDTYSSM